MTRIIRKLFGGLDLTWPKLIIAAAAAVVVITIVCLMHPPVYSTEVMGNSEEHAFDDTYKVSLADDKYGSVEIIYLDSVEDYFVHAEFKRAGKTVLTLESPSGEKKEYDLSIERTKYDIAARMAIAKQ